MNFSPLQAVLAGLLVSLGHAAISATLVIGQVGPLTGLESSQGHAFGAGVQLACDAVNKAGGINGNTFRFVRRDDKGRAEETVNQTRLMLAEDRPIVLTGYFGNQNLEALAASELLAKDRIALVGFRTADVRAEADMVFSVRAGLREEVTRITEHLATIGITRLGLLHEDTGNSALLVAAAEDAARAAKATVVARASYPPGSAQMSSAVSTFVKAQPQAILMVTSGAAAASFIEQYRQGGGTAQLFAHSGVDIEQLTKRLSDEQMQGLAIAQVLPSPYKISIRLTRDFNDLVSRMPKAPPVSYAMLEGYISARVVMEVVRRQGGRVSREGMISGLNSLDALDLGGYLVGFKSSRTGSRFVEMSIVTGAGRIRQ